MTNLPSWITDRAIPAFPGEPFRPEPDTKMFDEAGFAKLAKGFGLSKDRLHDKCDLSWTMKDGHKAWIFTDDVLSSLNKKRISVMESKGQDMKRRIREGIISTKDGEKTFDELYGTGIATDDSDFENARMFAHCFEAITKMAAPRLRENHIRERDNQDLPIELLDAVSKFHQERNDDWEEEQAIRGAVSARPPLRHQRERSRKLFEDKVKCICTHCGKKQTASEINYSLNYVACKFCGKEGELELLSENSTRLRKSLTESAAIPERMVADYEARAEAEMNAGATIELNRYPCYVAITMSDGSEYFFQDEEAEDLLNEVPDNISATDYILALAQGW